jgi:HEAT repeat protein
MATPSDDEALQNAAVALTKIIEDPGSSTDDKRLALWKRGECQQRMARNTDSLREVVSVFQSAQRDFSQSVKTATYWYAGQMRKGRWFPENPIFIPAYADLLSSEPGERWESSDQITFSGAARALGQMGHEADEVLPALERASTFKLMPNVICDIKSAVQRISRLAERQDSDSHTLFDRVEEGLQIYPTVQDRFELEHPLTEDDLNRSEPELVAFLADKTWAIRAKSACILRYKVGNPKPETLRALLEHLGSTEGRGNVRGQCALSLAHFASKGSIKMGMLETLIRALIERLGRDSAYAVKGIAAKALAQIGSDLPEVITSLVSVLSKPQNVNLQRALVEALGDCGDAAEKALPLILQFTPHQNDDTGEVVRAGAICRIAPADHLEARTSLAVIVSALGSRPTERREAALTVILRIRMDERRRQTLLLERLFFDHSAQLRCKAERALIELDADLARQAGA